MTSPHDAPPPGIAQHLASLDRRTGERPSRVGTFEEWRVTGRPGQGYPPYEFTWSLLRNPHLGDPETGARGFFSTIPAFTERWEDGPHLSRRTVTVTEWEAVEG
jgi:hypothetical protein